MSATVSARPEQRFSNRVENYVRHRPGYPQDILPLLQRETGLGETSVVADIGSGTGISTGLFLQAGCQVHAVEPNAAMRAAAEKGLRESPGFRSVAGTAQATTLPDASVDVITAAQSFHWFDTPETRAEFSRILKPGGHVVLIWNERQIDATPFLRDYEQLLLDYASDYQEVRHENISHSHLGRFFSGPYAAHQFYNEQRFDFEGLKGRTLSSSYTPPEDHPLHAPLLYALRRLFDLHQQTGEVVMEYVTQVYIGH